MGTGLRRYGQGKNGSNNFDELLNQDTSIQTHPEDPLQFLFYRLPAEGRDPCLEH